jgi:cytochrome P450
LPESRLARPAGFYLLRDRRRADRLLRPLLGSDGVRALQGDLSDLREVFTTRLPDWLGAQPELLRSVFGAIRRHHPVLVAPGFALVTTHADVREVLAQDGIFSVEPIYAQKMEQTSGAFILGMNAARPDYQRESRILRGALTGDDIEVIRTFVTQTADEIVDGVRARGRMDVVGELSRVVPARLIAHFFGVPGPDEPTLQRWMRTIFREIFINPTNDPEISRCRRSLDR